MKRYCLVFAVTLIVFVTFSFSGSYRHLGWANDNSPTANLAENTPEALEKESPSSMPAILWWFLTSNDSETLTANGVASPTSGPAPLSVSFTTGGNGPITMYRWDFNGDGLWDWEGSNAEDQSHTYTEAGTYAAVLQVEDEQGNTDDAQVVVTVVPAAPGITFSADDSQLFAGQSTLLQWSVTDAATVAINQGIGTVESDETQSVSPSVTTLYTLTATGPGGTSTADVEVLVVDPEQDDLVVYILNPEDGQVVVESTMTVAGSVNQPTAQVWVNGVAATLMGQAFSVEVPLVPGVNTLSATASYNGLTVGDSAWVVSDYVYTPQPDGSYGEQYEDLVPDDAEIPFYDKDRFSVILGVVENEQSNPLEGVTITIKNNPGYGSATTANDGSFYLPVEGGTSYTVVYDHDNYLTAHREIQVPENDLARVDTVHLVMHDAKATTVTFDGNPETTIIHESSVIVDSSGSRSMTMVFQGNNRAYQIDENGQRVRELSSINTRVTEFTTPEAMPSSLPPNSAFTYCSELSVDGVENVKFDQPVMTWVDNFLGFDIGEVVPVGYYDRTRDVWVPSENGVVVKLLDQDDDGVVDALDATGDDTADDLNANGSFSDEVLGLEDPLKYAPGDTYWRVAVTHFTPWDHNWPYFPPPDAIPPNPDGIPQGDEQDQDPEKEKCEDSVASSIEPRSRIFHEDIHIPGTDVRLHYASNRLLPSNEINSTIIDIPISGPSVPDSLLRIDATVNVAGQIARKTLPPSADQLWTYSWDGRDGLGRVMHSPTEAHISIGFVYQGVYASAGQQSQNDRAFDQAFAQPGLTATRIESRQEMTIWKHFTVKVQGPSLTSGDNYTGVANGWTLTPQHYVSPADIAVLYKGDGAIVQNYVMTIDTFAGGGEFDCWDLQNLDGRLATEADFSDATGIVMDSKGNTYLSNWCEMIFKVDPEGVISHFAGIGERCTDTNHGDGGPAAEACFIYTLGLSVDADDNVYVATDYGRVRKIDNNGIVTTVVGNDKDGDPYSECTNNCQATDNTLYLPTDVEVDSNGNIYVANSGLGTIGKVDPNGIYTTIAGCYKGDCSYSDDDGEGLPATSIYLTSPIGIALSPDGSIYFTDDWMDYVGKIDASGIFSVVAGSVGTGGFSGDGGLATEALLEEPLGIDLDPDGNIYVYDAKNRRIRKIDTSGIITTVAGTGVDGFNGDGGPATRADISRSWAANIADVAFYNDALYFGDSDNDRFRKVSLPPPYSTLNAGPSDITFTENNGLGHILTSTGIHKKTVDLLSGIVLRDFSYDNNNLVTGITDQFGNNTTFQYDSNGVPISITSAEGLITNLTIDAKNNLIRITYPDDSHVDFIYDQDGLLVSKIEPLGNEYSHAFDEKGRLTTASDQEDGEWNYTRDAALDGTITAEVTTAENNSTTFTDLSFSSGGSRSVITYPSANSSVTTWSDDSLTKTTDLSCGLSQTTRYTFDQQYKTKLAEEVQLVTPSGLAQIVSTSRTYADTNDDTAPDLVTTEISTNGNVLLRVQNTLTSEDVITSAEGRVTTISYDPATLLPTSITRSGIDNEQYQYDPQGRLTTFTQGARTTAVTYNQQGFKETFTTPGGDLISFAHDQVGRVTQVIRPGSNITTFGYDGNGNLTSITTPNGTGTEHSFLFNKVNRTAEYLPPDSTQGYTFNYDKERKPTEIIYPSGGRLTSTYTDNRLTSYQSTDGTTVLLDYLPGNKIEKMSRNGEVIDYSYDGQLLLNTTFGGTLDSSVTMGYNDDFLLTSLNYAGGIQNYSYDNDGLLITAGTTTISRNGGNGLAEQLSDTVRQVTRTYNSYGELGGETTTVNTIAAAAWNVTARDLNGQIITKEETFNGTSSSLLYAYDDLGRLITVTRNGTQVESYQYDANGNRIIDQSGLNYAYDNQDRLLSKGATSYTHSVDGFLESKMQGTDSTSYSYSLLGELNQVTQPDGTLIQYTYDPLGRRIAKSIDGTIVEKYLWADNITLLAIYDGSDNLIMRFEYADRDVPVSVTKDGNLYYLVSDYIGSLRLVVDAVGTVVKEIRYDSFGAILDDSNPGFYAAIGFGGGLHDVDTGFVYFGSRDYDPSIGRWTAKDSISFAGGQTNLYTYVSNDPVNLVDRNGMAGKSPIDSNNIMGEIQGGFVPSMLDYGANFFYETAEALAKARFDAIDKGKNDPCHEQNMQRYKDALGKIKNLKKQGENWSDIFTAVFGAINDIQDIAVDAGAKAFQMGGKGLSDLATYLFDKS